MVHLERLAEPTILSENKEKWLGKFIASGKDRPDSKQYGHKKIRDTLNTISHSKCFYCERLLKDIKEEVDHHIEVAIDKKKAFEWENLYSACDNCNDKINHNQIPVESVLDPFRNEDAEIAKNITFDKEVIRMNNASLMGDQTIKKYKLGSKHLDYLRRGYLVDFYDEYSTINENMQKQGNRPMTEVERESLLKYSYKDHPFSLMFRILLKRRGFLP